MGESNQHHSHRLPILLMGGAGGQLKGGRHLRYLEGTPHANLFCTLLDELGARVERFGDSTGMLDI
jgi:hypothetical protein